MPKRITILGAGFSSLAAACYLAKAGYDVSVLEKNSTVGGRARQLCRDGFTFDIGPTFYWMPDVFERFFNDFGRSASDFYTLLRLDPGYQVVFSEQDSLCVSADFEETKRTFESVEEGSGRKLEKFMHNAESNYEIAIKDLVYRPGESIFEIVTPQTALKLGSFVDTIKRQVARTADHAYLRMVLEFPVLFLGAKPSNTPSFYNFMNYADLKLGTWHPKGGMHQVALALENLAKSLGVKIHTQAEVQGFDWEADEIKAVRTQNAVHEADIVLSGADYQHTESLLPSEKRQYSVAYWNSRTFAPSALLFYVAFDKKLKNIAHHVLFFDSDFEVHAKSIYDSNSWPEDPLFYASFPSLTDDFAAPDGKEAGIFLIPISPDLEDTDEIREKYFNLIIERLERLTQQNVKHDILFKESFCVNDFKSEYNSFKGNAYGLANTLWQTHVLRPRLKSKKVDNLYFTGQLTLPGPGVPPALISGKVVSDLIQKYHGKV
ncbi:phytoene desaturase [Marinilongibacter aquaticus]|uniref:phytoene desaturase family protein n=1 Tax=Marinilongibacter aquaticus TaxID=2975157 RepID=UPI0021BD673B|nr:phytoene desaturase family protein [Marinilongibacter aquaticus]UBM58892.1 phytoene desaturase [Marinilongibacter aquaticus]